MMYTLISRMAIACLLLSMCNSFLPGQNTTEWTDGGSSNDYFDTGNWPNGVPEPNNNPEFLLSAEYSVKLTSAAEANIMTVDNGQVTWLGGSELNVNSLHLEGGELTIEEANTRLRSDGNVIVGEANSGSANLSIVGEAN